MSTRAIIGKTTGAEQQFRGIYSHSDGYPTWLGKSLWQTVHEQFHGDVKRFVREMITKHPGGWSSFGDCCYCHENSVKTSAPKMVFTDKDFTNGDDGSAEWLYIFDVENHKLFIRDVNHKEDVGVIDLDGPEPDWSKIECGENFERCGHYAWYHGLQPKTSNLSTQTYLGKRALEFRDAIAFIIAGKRYASTGCGGNSNYFNSLGRSFPRDIWVATIQAGNGKRIELPVAKITSKGYEPLPGVIWIYPPTKSNPNETEVRESSVTHG